MKLKLFSLIVSSHFWLLFQRYVDETIDLYKHWENYGYLVITGKRKLSFQEIQNTISPFQSHFFLQLPKVNDIQASKRNRAETI